MLLLRAPRSRQYYEGATTSHPRICGRLFGSLPQPTRSSLVRVSPQRCAPGRSEVSSGPGSFACAGHPCSGSLRVDANGISQVFRRSFLCLCCVPGPRSNRRVLAVIGHVDVAPAV